RDAHGGDPDRESSRGEQRLLDLDSVESALAAERVLVTRAEPRQPSAGRLRLEPEPEPQLIDAVVVEERLDASRSVLVPRRGIGQQVLAERSAQPGARLFGRERCVVASL